MTRQHEPTEPECARAVETGTRGQWLLVAYQVLCSLLFPASLVLLFFVDRLEMIFRTLPGLLKGIVFSIVVLALPLIGAFSFSGWGNRFVRVRISVAQMAVAPIFLIGLWTSFEDEQWFLFALITASHMAATGWRTPSLKVINWAIVAFWVLTGLIIAPPFDWFFSPEFRDLLPKAAILLSAVGLLVESALVMMRKVVVVPAEFP